MDNNILIINDVTGYGRVSTFAMLPIMSTYGLHPYVLPTALVSNTMDYGSSVILDTTDFMKSAIDKWDEFGFRFSNISTGLINSSEQADIIISLIEKQDSPFVLVDPIMADDGELYPNMYEGAIRCYRRLSSYASIIIPNLTEAELLADLFIGNDTLTDSQYIELTDRLSRLGPDYIVITGCRSEEDGSFNLLYSSHDSHIYKVRFDRIQQNYIGTGDVFSACLLSELINGSNLNDAVTFASDFVRQVIMENSDNSDHFDIRFEKSLAFIEKKFNL